MYTGELYINDGDWEKALIEFQEALVLTENHSTDTDLRMVALQKITDCQIDMGSIDSAIQNAKKYVDFADSAQNLVHRQRSNATMARAYIELADCTDHIVEKDDALRLAIRYSEFSNDLINQLERSESTEDLAILKTTLYLNFCIF